MLTQTLNECQWMVNMGFLICMHGLLMNNLQTYFKVRSPWAGYSRSWDGKCRQCVVKSIVTVWRADPEATRVSIYYYVVSTDRDVPLVWVCFSVVWYAYGSVSVRHFSCLGVAIGPQLLNGALCNWHSTNSKGGSTCQLGSPTVIIRGFRIALNVKRKS